MISYSELFKLLRKTISQHLFKVKSTLEKIGVQLWDLFMTVNTATKPLQQGASHWLHSKNKNARSDLVRKHLKEPPQIWKTNLWINPD